MDCAAALARSRLVVPPVRRLLDTPASMMIATSRPAPAPPLSQAKRSTTGRESMNTTSATNSVRSIMRMNSSSFTRRRCWM